MFFVKYVKILSSQNPIQLLEYLGAPWENYDQFLAIMVASYYNHSHPTIERFVHDESSAWQWFHIPKIDSEKVPVNHFSEQTDFLESLSLQ
jgi:hypothetical protein